MFSDAAVYKSVRCFGSSLRLAEPTICVHYSSPLLLMHSVCTSCYIYSFEQGLPIFCSELFLFLFLFLYLLQFIKHIIRYGPILVPAPCTCTYFCSFSCSCSWFCSSSCSCSLYCSCSCSCSYSCSNLLNISVPIWANSCSCTLYRYLFLFLFLFQFLFLFIFLFLILIPVPVPVPFPVPVPVPLSVLSLFSVLLPCNADAVHTRLQNYKMFPFSCV